MSIKDIVWVVGILIAMGATWGMTSQRVTALERDVDRIEQALIMFTKMDSRIAVLDTEVTNSNKKLDDMKK